MAEASWRRVNPPDWAGAGSDHASFARFLSCWGFALVLLLILAAPAFTQTTGKIQGRVVDAQTGEPIAGASVRVLGTSRDALTADDGYYFLNEVPAGLQTILAEFIGRRTSEFENQRVLAGQTTTLNFQLEVVAVEVEPLIVEGERYPLVPRDQVSSKAIVTGELVDALPIDFSRSIVTFQPGVILTAQGRTIRGGRENEEAVYVDGVLTRSYASGVAEPLFLPTNALEQVDVTTGAIAARFMEGQSGVVNYVTRSGGSNFSGSFSLFTDQLSPKAWRTGFNRLEASFGGPISRPANLSFFLAGTLQGQKYEPLNDGFNEVPILLPDGVAKQDDGSDAIFTLARTSAAAGAVDSLRVAFPNYVEWDNGRTMPFTPSDHGTFVGKLSWGLRRGSNVDVSYKHDRFQDVDLDMGFLGIFSNELYNPDGFDGFYSSADVFTLSGYFLLRQSPTSALALDLKASYQRYFQQSGELDPDWLRNHGDPAFGFNLGNLKFLVEADDWPVSEELVEAARSGVVPAESAQVFPGRFDLAARQSLPGLAEDLRMNPYGLRRDFEISGSGNTGLFYQEESDWVFNGTLDWQLGRYNRIQMGGDLVLIDARFQRVPLFSGRAIPLINEPVRAGLFITDRLDLGDLVIDAGLRWDYFDPNGDFPRVPGFVFNVPDSLKADFVRLEPGEGPMVDRVVPLDDCGGAATAPQRTRPDGTVVCKRNFIEASTKSVLSPRLAIAFPVTVNSTFRLSYAHNVQVSALQQQGPAGLGTAEGQAALFHNVYTDARSGLFLGGVSFGRDIDLPRTVLFEAGYRQLIGEDLVLDLAVYSKTVRNGLSFRPVLIEDPNRPGDQFFVPVLTNKDFIQIQGLDTRLDWRIGEVANVSGNYSLIQARGTGSDPTGVLRRQSAQNVAARTGESVLPGEVMLALDQDRRHNIAGTLALLFPPDFQKGSSIGSVLSDLGLFATFLFGSGLPFNHVLNTGRGLIGPPGGGGDLMGTDINSSRTSWEKRIDLRLTKGFRVGAQRVRLFVDLRNPFDLTNTNMIYTETGTVENELFRENLLNARLNDQLLDGDTDIDDFNIVLESPENEFNKFSLLQAEKRFGNGDGIFTVDEQREAFGAWYELVAGPQWFRESNQSLRLGFEILF